MLTATHIFAAVFGLLLLAVAWVCGTAAGRNHLSPWWLGSWGALLAGFAVLATAMGAAV